MLHLSRKRGERVIIGDPKNPLGTVTVVDTTQTGAARLGFSFSNNIPVDREEIAKQKALEPSEDSLGKCEGCSSTEAAHLDAEQLPLCSKCYIDLLTEEISELRQECEFLHSAVAAQ